MPLLRRDNRAKANNENGDRLVRWSTFNSSGLSRGLGSLARGVGCLKPENSGQISKSRQHL